MFKTSSPKLTSNFIFKEQNLFKIAENTAHPPGHLQDPHGCPIPYFYPPFLDWFYCNGLHPSPFCLSLPLQ